MSDDLDTFFKKKTNKKKKAGATDIQKLGKKLEKSAKRQEELDRENEERQQREIKDEEFIQNRIQEDAEWIDFSNEKELTIDGLKIKDMEEVEQEPEVDEDEQNKEPEHVRTWGQVPAAEVESPVENGEPEPAPAKPAAYMPPSQRLQHLKQQQAQDKPPSIGDQELFPSLGAAETIEKTQKELEKKAETRKKEQAMRSQPANIHPDPSFGSRTVGATEGDQSPLPPRQPPNPNSYVPPHLRGAAGGAGGGAQQPSSADIMGHTRPQQNVGADGFQHQSTRNRGFHSGGGQQQGGGGGAWGKPPPEPVSSNRFAGLRDD